MHFSSLIFLLVLFLHENQASSPRRGGDKYQACPKVKYHFREANQAEDYVRYRSYFPAMKEGTVCAWIELSRNTREQWFISYAVLHQSNEFLVGFAHNQLLNLWIGGTYASFRVPAVSSNKPLHVCAWFSSTLGQRGIYFDGSYSQVIHKSTNPVRGGGDMLLGQEQDYSDAGGLDAKQSYNGKITNLMIWPRVLTREEVSRIAERCECPNDFSVKTTLDRTELHGEASYSIPDICPTV